MTEPTRCLSCGNQPLESFLSLGRTPLANALLTEADLTRPELTFPLTVGVCRQCALVQILERVPPETLFRDYVYFSSYSDTMLQHAAQLAERTIRQMSLSSQSRVLEAASNDGYLLKNYAAAGVAVLGIEPARNVARVAIESHQIPTREEFFTEELAQQLRTEGLTADVFHAHNVLAHVPDLSGFLRGVQTILKPDGIAIVEVPYLGDMLDKCEFDTIYHEHLSYFSLTAMKSAMDRAGLRIVDVERVPIHGGSLRVTATHSGSDRQTDPGVADLLNSELAWEVQSLAPYLAFARQVEAIKTRLVGLVRFLKDQGAQLAAYGASAKGSTLLNYCGIGRESLNFVVDRSQVKQGRLTPGTHLRIEPPEALLQHRPDVTLLLTWNFADEILAQQAEYRRRGGRFLIPIPEPRLV